MRQFENDLLFGQYAIMTENWIVVYLPEPDALQLVHTCEVLKLLYSIWDVDILM